MSVPGKKSSVTRTVSNSSPLALCAVEKMMSAKRRKQLVLKINRNKALMYRSTERGETYQKSVNSDKEKCGGTDRDLRFYHKRFLTILIQYRHVWKLIRE